MFYVYIRTFEEKLCMFGPFKNDVIIQINATELAHITSICNNDSCP